MSRANTAQILQMSKSMGGKSSREYFQRYNAARRDEQKAYMAVYRPAHPEKWSTEATRSARLKHYYKNKVSLLAQSKARRDALQAEIDIIKSRPCLDCGLQYPPYVMDFDHVRGKKSFQIGQSKCRSRDKVLAEIAKCDVVCSNCHRLRTFKERK